MEQTKSQNIIYVLADLSDVPKANLTGVYGRLLDSYNTIALPHSRNEIKGLISIERVMTPDSLEEKLIGKPGQIELLEQISRHNNPNSIGLLTSWEEPDDKTNFYESLLHQNLSVIGEDLTYKGVRLIIFQYIDKKLFNPIIIPSNL